ncbi:Carboxypeptidase regulatory-like domain-containing protein [Granulicella rosea]|uniref:Carboxypeptidase regulatory-like domain-containing protein n=1 Tax=Granulicella rosea TaxID=474952 RepID=A0A239M7I9_9BACT|nr:carboxypeptidase regulatory-like domain-containing protein [Granulicella rosea]SNT38696.1 Carboxypeptidase regulatory-like domain-containing protein [Granulicella rosea]
MNLRGQLHATERLRNLTLAMLALVFLFSTSLFAQTAGSASVAGVVTDPTGATVPAAKVTLTNSETGTSRSTVTDDSGIYSLPNVPVGPYALSVTATGFSGYIQHGVLEVGNNIQINATLKLGASDVQIEVDASQAGGALETETSSYKQVIDQARITEMPLNGRQATQLILVSGGAVTAPTGDLVGSKTYATSTVIAVAGSQGNYNNYTLDGGSHTDTFTNTNLPYPFPDALREFSVESNSLPARAGLHPGALVNVVTLSGTNQWHGTAFDFIRNNIINATNFFSSAKDTLKRNQFGGTLGGKILKDKLFVFGGYQGTRNRQVGNATGYCIPTAAELAGDFSQMGTAATGSNCGINAANITDPISGANISATRMLTSVSELSPQAIALTKYLPLSQADQYGFIRIALPANYSEDQYIGRVDYTLNAKHSMFARYYLTNYNAPAYYSPTNLLLTTSAGNDERVQSFTFGETFIVTPTLVNTFHGTYARRRDTRGPTAGGINANTIGANLFTYVPADLRLTVTNGFSVGCGTCSPGFFNTNTEDFSDDIDYLRGKHAFAAGVELVRTGDNTSSGYLQNGNYSFSGLNSGVTNPTTGVTATGEGMIDFLTGQMNAFSQSRAQQTTYRQTIFGMYAQDTWHASPRLTLAVGLRWEPNLFQQDKFGRGSSFSMADFIAGKHSTVFPNAPAGSSFFGDAGVPKSFTDNRLANFSPRLGVTYDPFGKGKTVFRLGGAIMYDSPGLFATQRLTSNPPYTDEIDQTGKISLANPYASYPGGDPFPGVFPPNSSATFPTNTLYIVIPRHIQTPTVNQWTASVQQDLGAGWNMSLSYLGNKNSHLWLGKAVNPAVYIPGTSTGVTGSCGALTPTTGLPAAGKLCSSTANANNRTVLSLINPAQGAYYSPTMTSVDDGANSSYNGVIVAVQHRMSHNFSFLANYTWSHCIASGDANGDVSAPVYENPANPRGDRANCGFDIRHIFNTTFIARSNFKSLHGFTGALVNDWEIAPLVRILSGAPINVTTGQDVSLNSQGLDRPNLVNASIVYNGGKITQKNTATGFYLTKAAFAAQPAGTFGNLGRNAFHGPNYYDIDASINRTFPVYDRLKLNMRLEVFNLANHPFFNTFSTALNSATFGYATAANDPRIFQAAAKFTF